MAFYRRILAVALTTLGVCALKHQPPRKASGSPLPSIKQVLQRPRGVLKSMSSHVQELATHLAELQSHSTQEVSDLKAQYEAKLSIQRAESAGTERSNAALRRHIKHLQEDSANVRSHTVNLVQVSRHITEQLNAIREDFKAAGAVITGVLGEAEEKLSKSPKLQVLQELVEKDTAKEQDADQVRRFDEIVNPVGLALLQIGEEPGEPRSTQVEAKELVQSLMSSLGALTEEQNVSSESLKADFEHEWEAGVKLQSGLLTEQLELNTTEVHEKDRSSKLHTAFQHADVVRNHLRDRLAAIRKFAKRVGSRAMPESKTPTQADEALPFTKHPLLT